MKHIRFIAIALLFGAISCQTGSGTLQESEYSEADSANVQPATTPVATVAAMSDAEILAMPQVPVLCYHHIKPGARDSYSVTPAAFAAQMQALKDSGYTSILPQDLYNHFQTGQPLPEKPVMITFDDTRKEHFTIAAPEMEKRGFRGVFFLMTISINRKNYMTEAEIASLDSAGHTIGSHTWDHHKVTEYTEADWQMQIDSSSRRIQRITGKPVEYFAYPFGLWNKTAAQELQDRGMKLSFILSTSRDSTIPRQTIRRMIVPYNWSAQGMIGAMKGTFKRG